MWCCGTVVCWAGSLKQEQGCVQGLVGNNLDWHALNELVRQHTKPQRLLSQLQSVMSATVVNFSQFKPSTALIWFVPGTN